MSASALPLRMLASCLPSPSIFWTSAWVLLMISFLRCSPSLVVLVAIASMSETARSKAASRTCGHELDAREADVDQLDAAAQRLAFLVAVLGQGVAGRPA